MIHQVGPKQRKGNDKERIQTKYPFAKPVIRHQRRGLQWQKLGLPASALMFKKPWRTSVTLSTARDAKDCCRCTFRLVGYSFCMWREYWCIQVRSQQKHLSISISEAFWRNSDGDMWTFWNCDVETFEIQTGDIKTPPNRAFLNSLLRRSQTVSI